MQRCYRLLLFLLSSFLVLSVYADSLLLTPQEMQKLKQYFPVDEDSHLIWQGDALKITLPLNQEKRLVFPEKILPDLKNALTTDDLRLINNNRSLYLTALKPFSSTRLYVTLENSDQVILIDLMTDSQANATTTYVDLPSIHTFNSNKTALTENPETTSANADNDHYVALLRFAWQELYAPERLRNKNFGATRVPMHTEAQISTLIYGDKVYAFPRISWAWQGQFITVVELSNKYPHPTTIHLNHDICGDWQAASLYPRKSLKLMGDKSGDRTFLFLISTKPFNESLGVCDGHA